MQGHAVRAKHPANLTLPGRVERLSIITPCINAPRWPVYFYRALDRAMAVRGAPEELR
jgi:hypothetical protein